VSYTEFVIRIEFAGYYSAFRFDTSGAPVGIRIYSDFVNPGIENESGFGYGRRAWDITVKIPHE
jgi:hypothetical protein